MPAVAPAVVGVLAAVSAVAAGPPAFDIHNPPRRLALHPPVAGEAVLAAVSLLAAHLGLDGRRAGSVAPSDRPAAAAAALGRRRALLDVDADGGVDRDGALDVVHAEHGVGARARAQVLIGALAEPYAPAARVEGRPTASAALAVAGAVAIAVAAAHRGRKELELAEQRSKRSGRRGDDGQTDLDGRPVGKLDKVGEIFGVVQKLVQVRNSDDGCQGRSTPSEREKKKPNA